jgi:hypothetical protein
MDPEILERIQALNPRKTIKKEIKEEKEVRSIITEFDLRNDRKSLFRKLTNHLYLIVKSGDTWNFPLNEYNEEVDGHHLKKV